MARGNDNPNPSTGDRDGVARPVEDDTVVAE